MNLRIFGQGAKVAADEIETNSVLFEKDDKTLLRKPGGQVGIMVKKAWPWGKLLSIKDLTEQGLELRQDLYAVGPKSVNLFWVDKIMLLLDFAQIQGLLWLLGRGWAWPLTWIRNGSVFLLANLDIWALFSFGKNVIGVYSSIDYLGYLCFWLIGVIGAVFLMFTMTKTNPIARKYYLFRFGEYMVVPCILNLIRACSCYETGISNPLSSQGIIDARTPELNPVFYCYSYSHLMSLLVMIPLSFVLLIWFPYRLYRQIASLLVSSDAKVHENYLQQKELEWILKITPEWFVDHFRLVSSFKREMSFFRVVILLEKLALVAVIFGFRYHQNIQGQLLNALTMAFSIYISWNPPFRYRTSNRMVIILQWTMTTVLYFGCLKGANVKSALTTTPVLSKTLLFANVLGVSLAIFGVPILSIIENKINIRSKASSIQDICWPTNWAVVRTVMGDARCREWIREIHRSKNHIAKHFFTPNLLYPVHETLQHAEKIFSFFQEAEKTNSLLRYTLLEVYETLCGSLKAKVPVSLYPNDKLESAMPQFAQLVDRREREMILMNPTKCSMMLKLKAMSLWPSEAIVDSARMRQDALLQYNALFKENDKPDFGKLDRLRREMLPYASDSPEIQAAISHIDQLFLAEFQ